MSKSKEDLKKEVEYYKGLYNKTVDHVNDLKQYHHDLYVDYMDYKSKYLTLKDKLEAIHA